MNARQRRQYRRAIDRGLPPGTRVVERWWAGGQVYVVMQRGSAFERRDDWNKVLVEAEGKPFGCSAVSPRNLLLAPPKPTFLIEGAIDVMTRRWSAR